MNFKSIYVVITATNLQKAKPIQSKNQIIHALLKTIHHISINSNYQVQKFPWKNPNK